MKAKTLLWACAAVLFAAMVAGCVSTDSSAKTGGRSVTLRDKDVSFNSETGSLTIQNNASVDVVIFAGKIERNAILGGVRAGKPRTFDLSKIEDIPENGCLLIRAATFETYKGKARLTEADVIYTGLVVYNLKDKLEKSQLTIYENVDVSQKTCIYVSNESENYILELRLGNPGQGEVIATLPPLQSNKRIYLAPSSEDGLGYAFFPTFVFVDPRTGEKTSMNGGKTDRRRAIPRPVGSQVTPLRFAGPSKSMIGYDVAFLNLQNDTGVSLEFRNAETVLKNQKGNRFTHSGRSDVYEIPASNGEAGQLYTALTFEFDDYTKKSISPYKFKPGYKYDVIVTQTNGNYQYDIREVGEKSLVEDARIQLFGEN